MSQRIMGRYQKYMSAASIFIAALMSPMATQAETYPSQCKNGEPCLSWAETRTQTATPPSLTEIKGATLEWSRVSDRTISGLGPNERLCPTECPVGVMAPDGSQVLDCYKICTPVSGVAQIQTPSRHVQTSTVNATGTFAVSSVTLPIHRQHHVVYAPVAPAVIFQRPAPAGFLFRAPMIVPSHHILPTPCARVYC